MGTEPRALTQQLIDLTREAGSAAMEFYREQDPEVHQKEDNSPLTRADVAANDKLQNGLSRIQVDGEGALPVLSEESEQQDYSVRRSWKKFWLVDPLDGTREFIKKNGEFTINVALVENGQPAMGVVYVPALKVMYYATDTEHAWRCDEDGEGQRLDCDIVDAPANELRVVASRSHMDEETSAFIEQLQGLGRNVETVSAGSSLKFCLVAQGHADLYPRFGRTMEWDTAAAQAVLQASGGRVVSRFGHEPLRYNKQDLANPHFIAFNARGAEMLHPA